jgi:hypothetical protein
LEEEFEIEIIFLSGKTTGSEAFFPEFIYCRLTFNESLGNDFIVKVVSIIAILEYPPAIAAVLEFACIE